jgi:hypothetical protein
MRISGERDLVADTLGRIAARYMLETFNDFCIKVRLRGHPVRQFVQFMDRCRVSMCEDAWACMRCCMASGRGGLPVR